MISETLVRTFLTLARTRNMTEAAHRLYLSQQAVSKHLARLEEDLSCPLFSRERGGMTLTEQGEIYFEAFSRMEDTLTEARRRADRLQREEDSRLVICHLHMLDVNQIIKPIYRAFAEENPDVRLVYQSNYNWTDLLEGRVDLVFTFREDARDREGLAYVPVKRLQELLMVAADHPLATPDAVCGDFSEEPVFYTLGEGKDAGGDRMSRLGVRADRLVETDGLLASCAAVEMGQGITFVTEYCRLLEGSGFRTYPTGESATLVMAYPRESKKKTLRRFVRFVEERVAEEDR